MLALVPWVLSWNSVGANLWGIDSYTVDAWGVTIKVTSLPMPGFDPARKDLAELSSVWEMFHVDESRWQSRYGWKFLLGDEEVESVIAAGTEAAARGLLLTDSQVLGIFRWRVSLQSRKEKNLGNTDFISLLDSLLTPPPVPVPPPAAKD